MKGECKNCLAWELYKDYEGFCHRKAPIAQKDEDGAIYLFPTTLSCDWCLEFVPEEE